jgi:hypothetical protein
VEPEAGLGSSGRLAARLALAVGAAYALVSAYWAAGGTRLLGTVGGSLEVAGRSRGAWIVGLLWLVVVLKLAAAALPLVAIDRPGDGRPVDGRSYVWARRLGWVAGWLLSAYGFVLTLTGLLVESGIVDPGRGADRRALAYHAFLWDPWFLVWGVLVLTALRCSVRPGREERRAWDPRK